MHIAGQLDTLKEEIEALRDAEQEAFDNMHENFQQGEKGSAMEEGIAHLDDAIDELGQVAETLGSFSGEGS